ncbi:MAG: hydrogenase maturation nickel metallochaperone HypA [Candidatus Omnitrophota bacterium]|jgi:Zn finger protein HypA/HybF involved in hydrogenase expression
MHDLKYAHQILDGVKKKAGASNKNKTIIVDVYLSPFSHVTPERLKDTFLLISEDEGYKNVVLNVSISAFCVHCKKCGNTWKSAKPTFKCPKCDSPDFELEKWEEFYIDSIRIEKKSA